MDVQFNVPNAGPLTAVSLHLLSFRTAVHLATGAVGWWKARERTRSFSECISANKAVLVGTTSFNSKIYKEKRNQGFIQGLVVEQGCLQIAQGRIETTAVARDFGVNCLRALTTGLLCFYGIKSTTTILSDIIPFGLIQVDQEDDVLEFTGPLLTSLTEFVTAVVIEEDCNSFRKHLLQKASDSQNNLREATVQDILQCEPPIGEQDMHLVIGLLRWIAMPRFRRSTPNYPTRSLRVWLLAVIMQELGFETTISLECVTTSSDYADFVSNPRGPREFFDVILVTASVGLTDPMMLKGMVTQSIDIRPQITTLGGLPYTAFSRLQEIHSRSELGHLVDIWRVSFQSAQKAVQLPVVTGDRLVWLEAVSEGTKATRERHRSLSHIWSPHLAMILGPPMTDFVPSSLMLESWSAENIEGYFELEGRGEGMFAEEVRANAFKLRAIISGTIYGIAAMSLIPNSSQANSQEFVEVAFQPNLLHGHTLFTWARTIGEALHGMLAIYSWKDFILELATGISSITLKNQLISERLQNDFKDVDPADSCVFGAQANGIFAVSDFIARPSTQVNNVLKFHIGTGRILNLPVDENGFLHSSEAKVPVINFRKNPGPPLDILSRQPTSHNPLREHSLRIDAEPDWTGNPKTIQFSVRIGGILIAQMNLGRIIWRLSYDRVSCNCIKPKHKVKTPLSEGWKIDTIDSLLQPSHNDGSVPYSAHVGDEVKMMIDVYGDEMHRLYAVGILFSRRLAISASCVECAYESIAAHKRSRKESAVLIVG